VSQTAIIITVSYVIAVLIGSAISLSVFLSTKKAPEDRTGAWSRRETTWLVVVILALFALLLGTIFYVPYGETAGPNGQFVRVVGRQYAWQIDQATPIVTGRPVTFVTRSVDVAHGFGVYNPDDVLIFQAQVVANSDQKIVHTFSQSGTYTVRCLEFCGAGHHLMESTFEVKAQ